MNGGDTGQVTGPANAQTARLHKQCAMSLWLGRKRRGEVLGLSGPGVVRLNAECKVDQIVPGGQRRQGNPRAILLLSVQPHGMDIDAMPMGCDLDRASPAAADGRA